MSETFYHGYKTIGQRKDEDWDGPTKWTAEVYDKDLLVFRFRLIVERLLVIEAERGRGHTGFLEENGLCRIHARLDFGDFVSGETP